MAYSETAILINVIVSSTFAVFGTFGNILVIAAFFSVRSLRTINNIFVLQLAFVDLTKASFTLTVKSVNQAKGTTSIGDGFCEVTGMLRTIGSCQSAVLLAAIATVRYVKVVRPRSFSKLFTLKRTLIYCAMICGSTMLLAVLPVVGLGKYTYSKSHGACFVTWAKINIAFRSIYYVINVGISFPVLIFCYYNIFTRLREHSRAITPRIGRKGRSTVSPPEIKLTKADEDARRDEKATKLYPRKRNELQEADGKSIFADSDKVRSERNVANDSSLQMAKNDVQWLDKPRCANERTTNMGVRKKAKKDKLWFRLKRERSDVELEVTKVMFAIFIAYAVCWLPAAVVNILNLSQVIDIHGNVLLLIVTLVDLKVCLNPLIYGIGSKQFRHAFLHVLIRRTSEQDTVSANGPGTSAKIPSSEEPSIFDDNKGDLHEVHESACV